MRYNSKSFFGAAENRLWSIHTAALMPSERPLCHLFNAALCNGNAQQQQQKNKKRQKKTKQNSFGGWDHCASAAAGCPASSVRNNEMHHLILLRCRRAAPFVDVPQPHREWMSWRRAISNFVHTYFRQQITTTKMGFSTMSRFGDKATPRIATLHVCGSNKCGYNYRHSVIEQNSRLVLPSNDSAMENNNVWMYHIWMVGMQNTFCGMSIN